MHLWQLQSPSNKMKLPQKGRMTQRSEHFPITFRSRDVEHPETCRDHLLPGTAISKETLALKNTTVLLHRIRLGLERTLITTLDHLVPNPLPCFVLKNLSVSTAKAMSTGKLLGHSAPVLLY